jgi:hypothetical protein
MEKKRRRSAEFGAASACRIGNKLTVKYILKYA